MQKSLRGISGILTVLIVLGVFAGLVAAAKRFRVESHNRRVEIALEWQEVTQLAQATGRPVPELLTAFRTQGVSTLVLQEETLTTLEQSGALHPNQREQANGVIATYLPMASPELFQRIKAALEARNIKFSASAIAPRAITPTVFQTPALGAPFGALELFVPMDYASLRTMGLGLPPEGVKAAQNAELRIAGRIGNFPGVSESSAEKVVRALQEQGAKTVIFSGEEALGYRGLEKEVANLFRSPDAPALPTKGDPNPLPPLGIAYGAVEFGKQKGDEKLSAALHGDFVRVHSIQAAEMGQVDEEEAVERFEKAARERNIRFCYVRLLTFAGKDPVEDNVKFLGKIAAGMRRGSALTGGDLRFGAARRYEETGVPTVLFAIMGLSVAAGLVWMLRTALPLPDSTSGLLLGIVGLLCMVCAWRLDETGRKLVALLAGIVFPTVACLRTFPRTSGKSLPPNVCLSKAVQGIVIASGITAIGIIHVVGLLATRPFMVHASQFLGIKAQHAVPLLLVALVAVAGGVTLPDETWARWKARAAGQFRAAMQEPARFGLLIIGIVALAAIVLIVARTGNDAGVGVSGAELKGRAILDRILPVRPRTKEFLVGHPLFILGLAWWWRGRRRLGLPCLVFGSLGQVSLLNTFCHIHTPLIISAWRDGIGLVLGVLLGAAIFLLVERFTPPPRDRSES
ncbi:MAG: hypothetical protein JWL77_1887 [Chthonomonadaceae bacterium]|nr:hypothetical protein [Chthonomonadaceae bacterium]